MRPILESVLFRTSAASDIQCSGGVLTVAGLSGVKKKNILSIKQVKYRAEVVQVATVSTTFTPVGSTEYAILIGDPNRQVAGAISPLKKYAYVTPASITDLGATAALQREAINVALIAKINADASNYVVAATSGGGAGFTVTDDAGYYPPQQQGMTNRKGASTVKASPNEDGSGMPANAVSITTAAVIANGVGADLLLGKPVIDQMYGNLIQGSVNNLFAPPVTSAGLPAVSGQEYDAFVIESLYDTAPAHNQTGQYALVPKTQTIWVDTGTGSSTTNLAGFKAFERVMHKLMVEVYKNDASTVHEWFDRPLGFQDPLGAAPSGTADILGWQLSNYTNLNRTNIGTQTIVAPVLDDTGLLLDQDDTAGEGSHTSANQQVLGDQSFIVGKTAFMVVARVVAADWTDTQFMVGFRKKAVYAADYNNYTDLAAIGGGAADGDSITTQGILNNAATVATDSGTNFADNVSMLLIVKVALDGTVSAYFANANGGLTSAPIYSVGTTTLVFDADDEMIPFYQHVNIGSGNPAVSIGEFFAVASDKLIA